MGQVVILQVAATWLDTHGWVVALGVGVLVFVLSIALGRRPAAMPLRGRGGFSPEEIAARTVMFAAAGASPAVAEALARGSNILAIRAYRDETGVGLREGKDAVDRVITAALAPAFSSAGASPAVATALARGDTLLAIRRYRAEHGVGLREAKEAIDRLTRAARTPHAQA